MALTVVLKGTVTLQEPFVPTAWCKCRRAWFVFKHPAHKVAPCPWGKAGKAKRAAGGSAYRAAWAALRQQSGGVFAVCIPKQAAKDEENS